MLTHATVKPSCFKKICLINSRTKPEGSIHPYKWLKINKGYRISPETLIILVVFKELQGTSCLVEEQVK